MSPITYFEKKWQKIEKSRPFLWFLQKKGKDVTVLLLIKSWQLMGVIKTPVMVTV